MTLKSAADVAAGDILDGKTVVEVRGIQFRRLEDQNNARALVDSGMTTEQATEALGLVEGEDWRWTT